MVDYYMQDLCCEINLVVVGFVCEMVDEYIVKIFYKFRFVVGLVGFINKICFMSLDVNNLVLCVLIYDELVVVYQE